MKHNDTLFSDFPQLQDIHDRLEESFKQYDKDVKEYKENRKAASEGLMPGEVPAKKSREWTPPKPDQFRITRYLSQDGVWEETIYSNKEGGKEFKQQLRKVMDGNDPDAIVITLYPRKRSGNGESKDYTIYFNKEAKAKESSKKDESLNIDALKADILGELEKESGSPSVKLLQMGFNHKLEVMGIKSDYEKKLDALKRQNETLLGEVDELTAEIDLLEGDLEEKEYSLGSINKQWEKKEKEKDENPLIAVFGSALTRMGEGLIVRNPEFLDNLGFDESAKKSLVARLKNQLEKGNSAEESTSTAGASFADEDTSWTAGKDQKHVEAIKTIFDFCKDLPFEDFKKVWMIFSFICNEDVTLNNEVADLLIKFAGKKEPEPAA